MTACVPDAQQCSPRDGPRKHMHSRATSSAQRNLRHGLDASALQTQPMLRLHYGMRWELSRRGQRSPAEPTPHLAGARALE